MKHFLFIFWFGFACSLNGQSIPSPDEFLGYELGSSFTRHHQVTAYFRELALRSPSTTRFYAYGKTKENRELITLFISSPENIAKLEDIKKKHKDLSEAEQVAIVWMSYNVHGNESAGTEASMKTAYELITNKAEWLKNTVVIIDPCINPDGRDRYVNWYHQMLGQAPNIDRNTREHEEPWPGGRPNHYYFDLNRDWAWNTQLETQQRLKLYNEWLPHVHVDFHEQGIDDPYYFAPAAEPYHKVITPWQRSFQNGLGRNHTKYFDRQGWLYFTREIFDLLYPSYGDTYPTFTGAIGMTYEQGGSGRAGLQVKGETGQILSLKDRLEHHHVTGISTVEFSHEQAGKLIKEQRSFMTQNKFNFKSFVLRGEPDKIQALCTFLDQHEIQYASAQNVTTKGWDYHLQTENTWNINKNDLVVRTDQKKGALVHVLFEPFTELTDSLTYDITAWSLPFAYGLNALSSKQDVAGTKTNIEIFQNDVKTDPYGYLVRWNDLQDARLLSELLQHNIVVRVSENPFEINGKPYDRGTLIILKGDNQKGYDSSLVKLANEFNILLESTNTGMVDKGSDFGAASVKIIGKRKVLLLSGETTSSLNVGEIWHFMDNELHYPLSIIDERNFDIDQLDDYDVLIVPEGDYHHWTSNGISSGISKWVEEGGQIIILGSALHSFAGNSRFSIHEKSTKDSADGEEIDEKKDKKVTLKETHEHQHQAYNLQERQAISSTITGAIINCQLEETHPLSFGYKQQYASLKLSADYFELLENGGNVCFLNDKPNLLAGFVGSKVKKDLGSTLVFGVENIGNGAAIYMVDNPLFRGFWENGKLFFANALFMVNN